MRAVVDAVAVSVTVPAVDVDDGVDVDVVEAQRVAERDQLAGALGGLDAGDAGGAEDVALRRVAGRDRAAVAGAIAHDGPRDGAPRA